MFKYFKQMGFLIIAGFVSFGVVFGVGYYFAKKKSEPIYLSKVDKLMFDQKNQPPKFILTLPDKIPVKKVSSPNEVKTINLLEADPDATQEEKVLSGIELFNAIPLLSKLEAADVQYSLTNPYADEALLERKGDLVLPQISSSGKRPWSEYGNLVNVAPNFYKIAVIIKSMGFDSAGDEYIINALPPEVSISFTPYGLNLKEDIIKARKKGHETYMDLILPSKNYLQADTGPLSMNITNSQEENLLRLKKALSVEAPIGGMLVNPGMAADDSRERIRQILEELKNRGLLIVDGTDEDGIAAVKVPGLARKKADLVIYDDFSAKNLQAVFDEAEEIARQRGVVLLVVEPKPVVIKALSDWFKTFSKPLPYEENKEQAFEKPFALVPVSNTVVE